MDNEKQRPAHEIRYGRIKATIWKNESESGTFYSTQFSRLYKAGDEWRTTDSFNRDDLPLLSRVADKAFDWIYQPDETVEE